MTFVAANLHLIHGIGLAQDELIVCDAELSEVGGDVSDESGFELSEVDVLFPDVPEDDVGCVDKVLLMSMYLKGGELRSREMSWLWLYRHSMQAATVQYLVIIL